MIVFSWDEVTGELTEWPQEDPPAGLSDRDLLLLADSRISAEIEEPFGTFNHKIRNEDGVLVLEAQFGRHKVCRTYVCLTDPNRARALAEQELEAFMEA